MAGYLKTMEELYTLQVLFDVAGGSTNTFDVPIAEEYEDNWIRKLGLEREEAPVTKYPGDLSEDNRFDLLGFLGVGDDEHEYIGTEFVFVVLESLGYDPAAAPGAKLLFSFRVNAMASESASILVLATVGLSHSIMR
jgi:hypothetical protein